MDSSNHLSSIAIVGMSGAFPGARDISDFWKNIINQVESVTILDEEQALQVGIDQDTLKSQNFVPVSNRLQDIEYFDAEFFGYSPKEASIMDPQQRLLLEHAHLALEDAGYCPEKTDSKIGIYAGIGFSTYLLNHVFKNQEACMAVNPMQIMIANDKDYAATRVAYKLGLTGPGVNLGTACSTSLVAIHLASRSLLSYEADMVLAGGVKVDLLYQYGQHHTAGGIFSSDGHTRAFDAKADGTTFGDGAGMVVLKRLQDAVDDGDHIYAVIRGSAINNDGHDKIGYTAPSITSQAEVISMAQAIADVPPNEIGYVEAHGTGTPLGDPIEVAALTRAFREGTDDKQFCAIGSVKTNVGHLDVASGVAGFIKAVKSVKEAKLPASLHFESPNPEIHFDSSPFYVNTQLTPWPSSFAKRVAGVSSFGVGGTNAHMVIEQAPTRKNSIVLREYSALQLSAKNADSLASSALNLANHLECNPTLNLADVAYTLRVGRQDHGLRQSVTGSHPQHIIEQLRALANSKKYITVDSDKKYSVCFMFSGQGTQYIEMAKELFSQERVFREEFEACSARFQTHLSASLVDVIFDNSPLSQELDQTWLAQPAIFCVEYALAKLLMSFGITPKAMIGHSLGEYVAACLAGVFSLQDATYLVATRGRVMQKQTPGSMLAVALSEQELISSLDEHIDIAAINGAQQCVVSGPSDAIATFTQKMSEQNVRTSSLVTSHAFHSAMMTPAMEEFADALNNVTFNAPSIRIISNLTGSWVNAQKIQTPQYWLDHIREPVRFFGGLQQLAKISNCILLEVGPGAVLTKLARRGLANKVPVIDTLPSKGDVKSASHAVSEALAKLWENGLHIDWHAYYSDEKLQRVSLPGYAFSKQKFWIEATDTSNFTSKMTQSALHKCTDPADWFYVPVWQQSIVSNTTNSWAELGPILFLADDHGQAMRVYQHSEHPIVVTSGNEFKKLGHLQYSVNPADRDSFNRLAEELNGLQLVPKAMVNFWPLNVIENNAQSFADDRKYAYDGLVNVCLALGTFPLSGKLPVLSVTQGAFNVFGEDIVSPVATMVPALTTVLNQELPHLDCKVVDFDKVRDLEETSLGQILCTELSLNLENKVSTYRQNQRWCKSYQHYLGPISDTPNTLESDSVIVITGGLGNVGFVLAQTLAKQARVTIHFIGRSELAPPQQWNELRESSECDALLQKKLEKIHILEQLGARVHYHAADVSDLTQLTHAFDQAIEVSGKVTGIIHGAGHYAFATIDALTAQDVNASFLPKAQGVHNLAKVYEKLKPEFCLLLSSISSVLGGLGYAPYAASNAYLDGFCETMRHKGHQGWTTLNWDAWKLDQQAQEDKSGLMKMAIEAEEGEHAFELALAYKQQKQLIISTADLNARVMQWTYSDTDTARDSNTDTASLQTISDDPIMQKLYGIWVKLFGMDAISLDDDFFELGGDSLLGMNFVSEFQREFGVNIYVRAIFEAPTISTQAAYVHQQYPELTAKILGQSTSLSTHKKPLSWQNYMAYVERFNGANQDLPVLQNLQRKQVFILSPPRAGSTLLRVMMAANSHLCAPPELELLCFKDLAARQSAFSGNDQYRNNGLLSLIKYVYDCEDQFADDVMAKYLSGNSIESVYADISNKLGERILVDKSPVYSHSIDVLRRAELMFEGAVFINLQRHPCGMIQSHKKARLDLLSEGVGVPAEDLAEVQWNLATRTIELFLEEIPKSRQWNIKFEDLIATPNEELRALCEFLNVPYEEAMLEPYSGSSNLMTSPEILVGDPNFHRHSGISTDVAQKWRDDMSVNDLADFTREFAASIGYEMQESVPQQPVSETAIDDLEGLSDQELDALLNQLS
ncbi:SDR family NAD(P)-dependent oxidoreductase [Pseudoalteromonas sp. MMG013]|uniref:type I polyketide synthase n=1 Tax=Pseudoalteromonas sp. MMG013 TaxID=2822687 RepID=UPI001B38C778|nr:type I polyketide synthase [Pseudoalteromonas sp. MMG013]MBQ4862182.1 SDR family NAD(P)-dependent oxidoreductase [Pseudoalteromonas sp. MMG013]